MRVISFGSNLKTKPTYTQQPKETEKSTRVENARDAFGLPRGYTINSASAYFPNLNGLKKEQLFDIQYSSALTLSDGSKLIRPICLSVGDVNIEPTENEKEYLVTVSQTKSKDETQVITKTLSEDELLNSRWLSRGKLTKNKEGKFPYHLEFEDSQGDIKKYNVSKKGCLDILEKNLLYI